MENVSIEKLLHLQQLDVEIDELKNSASIFPSQLQEIRAKEAKTRQAYETAKAQLETLEREHKDSGNTLELEDQRLKKSKSRLKLLKTPYEFQALSREIENTKRSNEELEEKILKIMQQIETLKTNLTPLEEEWKKSQEALQAVENETQVKVAEFDGILRVKLEDQKKLHSDIERPILAKYLYIQKRYRDVVVPVRNSSCQGCYRNIPHQMFNEMLKSRQLDNCPNCHRLIYVSENPSGNA